MTVTEVTDTTSISEKVVKKFTTDLAAGGAMTGGGGGGAGRASDVWSGDGGSGVVILQYIEPRVLIRSGFEWL